MRHRYMLAKVSVGLLGIVLSIIAHELFHVALHHNTVSQLRLFDADAIVSMHVVTAPGYDMTGEEEAAYGITLLVLLGTVAAIGAIHNRGDARSSAEMIFGRDHERHKLAPGELHELAYRVGIVD